MITSFEIFPYSFLATQTYFPMSVRSAVNIIMLLWCCCGQEKQDPGMDQLYTGSGNDDTLQFSITCIPMFAIIVSIC